MSALYRSALVAVTCMTAASPSNAVGPTPSRGAEDAPTYADWSGPYVGLQGSAGGLFGRGLFSPTTLGPRVLPTFSTGFGQDRGRDTPILVGAHGGINWQTGPILLGLEADVNAIRLKRAVAGDRAAGLGFADADPALALIRIKNDALGSLRVRGGLAFGPHLLYVTAGIVGANARLFVGDPAAGVATARFSDVLVGYTAGVGLQTAIAPQVSLGIEYRFSSFGGQGVPLGALSGPDTPASSRLNFATHQTMARLTWHPGGLKLAPDRDEDETGSKDWSIHGQSAYFQQGVSGFRSPYIGPNSLFPRQARETWTLSGFIGRRLWDGGEVYFNPEFNQGFGLSNTLGLAGYVNGEAQKAGAVYPFYRSQRYFLRQTFGLGGEQERVEDGIAQIAGWRDIDRITVTVGKFAVGDIFDDNAYAHDPRTTFNNWALWGSGAYDFPANLPGITQGIVVDLNRKDWAVRAGYFKVPKEPNSDVLDPRVLKKGGAVVEFEERHALFGQAGKLRLGAFANRGRMGNFRTALDETALVPGADPNDVIAIDRNRRDRMKTGVYANLEQAITPTLGVFARASINDGRNEILSFTDIDRSLSGGVSIKGAFWGRPDDVWGIGAAVNGLSKPHREFLAAGGLGLLIGDGRLAYAPERIVETYYALRLTKLLTATLDYQFIANPAYNAERGPASFVGLRLRAEY